MTQGSGGAVRATYALLTGLEWEFHFVLVGDEGELLLTSRPHARVDELLAGLAGAKELGPDIEGYERWHVEAGWGFTLRGPGGELGHGGPFPNEAQRDAALESARRLAQTDGLLDLRVAPPPGATD